MYDYTGLKITRVISKKLKNDYGPDTIEHKSAELLDRMMQEGGNDKSISETLYHALRGFYEEEHVFIGVDTAEKNARIVILKKAKLKIKAILEELLSELDIN